ncbi:outer membrane lipoprotein carrier protein LolA [Pueribacillus sp. YX66]|uniref:LolA family protein n=1 Tax=Pueribacillus sp. YX66 TaxID=3229242 RepID=UPI00358CF1CB
MKKTIVTIVSTFIFATLLVGCGSKSQEDVLEALSEKTEKMQSYKMTAKMTFESGDEPQLYDVEIWHKKPSYYRIKIENDNNEQSQIILRNDEGVFVLTPALNKSFRFQSDWPENNSQIYLYESLVNDVLNDGERSFKAKDDAYVFKTKTNYQNKNLFEQEITFTKKKLEPKQIKVMDQDMNVLVTADFDKVEFDADFDDDAFDMDRNMTSAKLEVPTMAEIEQVETSPLYPEYTAGTNLSDEKEVTRDGEKQLVLTYTGEDESFTLIQKKADVAVEASAPVHFVSGEPVDLGFVIGIKTGDTISWTYNGMDFLLASKDLDEEEMVAVARSVQGVASK